MLATHLEIRSRFDQLDDGTTLDVGAIIADAWARMRSEHPDMPMPTRAA